VLWKLRAIVYGCLAIVIALVLIGGGGEEEELPVFLDGATSQGRAVTMELEDGRPTSLGMSLDGACRDGSKWFVRWWSFDGRTARFRFDDGRLVVREQVTREYDNGYAGERNYTLEARIADGRVTGTVRGIENVTGPGERYVCESPEVTFAAG
jgi:hypothetical protein